MKTMKYIYTITALLFATLQTFAQTYEYDDNNRLTKVTYPNGATVSYTYDVLGNRLSKTVTGGEETNDSTFKATTAEGVEVTYKIINEEEKTCQVFASNSQTPAIDTSTTGSVTIPAEVNGYKVTSIGVNAFKNCQELTKVILPESVTIINTDAFAGCVKLAEIIFPSKVSDFNQHIFDDTPWYANQPDGPLYINNLLYTYKGEMPENTVINVPEGCTSISNMAFASQVNLKGIELPTSLERIGYQAFLSSGIKEIIIPANCAMIYMRAFKDCGSLEEVTFLGKTGMGAGVFSKCPNLKTITVNSPEPFNVNANAFYYRIEDINDNSIFERATLYVPHGSKEAYQAVAPWSEFQNIVEMSSSQVIEATCKQVIDGPDGTIYRVTGVCKEIKNTTYGNWYLEDETGTIYIYGTVDSNGQYPRYTSWESFGINVGDTITVQGPKTTYANTPELVNVQVLRPLTLLSGDRININCEERVDTIRLYCEGDSYEVEIPADATWVTIKEQTTGKNPIIVLHIDENKGVSRGTAINISSTIKGQKYEKTVLVTQHPYYFKAKTVEGVELSYRVVTETPTKTCYVSGAGEDLYAYYAALDTLTTGHVTIPTEVNGYTVTALDGYAFMNCRNITGVTMPESLWLINSYAFKGCNSLADIQFSSNLNSMGLEIFEETAWFANQPDGMVYINDSLLYVYKGEVPADTPIKVKEGCTYIGYAAFTGQSNLTSITLPETVKTIEGFAFSRTGIKEVVIPKSCTLMGGRSFYYCSELEKVTFLGQPEIRRSSFSHCDKLSTIICQSETAWSPIYTDCFYLSRDDKDASIYQRATLYVPHGSKEAYQAVAPWSEFQNIVEMDLAPIDNGANVNIGTEINSDTNLDGNVVGNILYNISSGNGEFDPENGCIVVSKPVSDETMNNLVGKDIFGEDFKDQYTGIVFKVAEGKGEIKVMAQTTGNMVLKIKIGNGDPIEKVLGDKQEITFPYNVTEETLVYIYGSTKAAQAKRKMKGVTNTESGTLKIFGIEITREGTGIQDITLDEGPQDVYSLSGQKVRSQAKDLKGLPAGVYIVGGKKIFVK
ncbi:MAG: leucine-rich repeat protein [Prevotella sp.]|nr:leucine-rich repeat protein [Prevotella sp.]